MKLDGLWRKRRAHDLRTMAPYWRYMMSSGGVAIGFAVIMCIQGYATLLSGVQATSEMSPALTLSASLLIALSLLWNPARTYLVQPDLVFLLPKESKMNEYLLGAWKSGLMMSGLLTAAAVWLYWPFYRAVDTGSAADYCFSFVCLLALKALLYYGSWKERQFRYTADRIAFAAAKSIAALATCFALLRDGPSWQLAFLLILWAAYAAAIRLPAAYSLHWEHLLQLERRTISLHEAWFSLFTDLPHRVEVYKPRPYLNGLLRFIPYRKERAFHYKYWRSFLRSPLLIMAVRIILLEAVLIWLFPAAWSAAAIYVLFCWMLGLQLRSIQSAPTEPLLAAVIPLPAVRRTDAQRDVQRVSSVAAMLLMGVPLLLVAPFPLAAGCIAAAAAASIIYARRRRRSP